MDLSILVYRNLAGEQPQSRTCPACDPVFAKKQSMQHIICFDGIDIPGFVSGTWDEGRSKVTGPRSFQGCIRNAPGHHLPIPPWHPFTATTRIHQTGDMHGFSKRHIRNDSVCLFSLFRLGSLCCGDAYWQLTMVKAAIRDKELGSYGLLRPSRMPLIM